MSDKTDLRRQQFAALKEFSFGDRGRASQKICGTLSCLPMVKSSALIAGYVAMRSEPDIMALMKAPPCPGGRIALSRLSDDDQLEFRVLESPDQLVLGSQGIMEPDPRHCAVVEVADIDLMLTPGVAFDPHTFARLGRGKGHYDRIIAKLRASRATPAPVLGIGFQLQLVTVPTEAHDELMDGLITEANFYQTPR